MCIESNGYFVPCWASFVSVAIEDDNERLWLPEVLPWEVTTTKIFSQTATIIPLLGGNIKVDWLPWPKHIYLL